MSEKKKPKTKRIVSASTVYHLVDDTGRVYKTFRLTENRPATVFRLEAHSAALHRTKAEQIEEEAMSYFGALMGSLEELAKIAPKQALELALTMGLNIWDDE